MQFANRAQEDAINSYREAFEISKPNKDIEAAWFRDGYFDVFDIEPSDRVMGYINLAINSEFNCFDHTGTIEGNHKEGTDLVLVTEPYELWQVVVAFDLAEKMNVRATFHGQRSWWFPGSTYRVEFRNEPYRESDRPKELIATGLSAPLS